MSPLSGAPGDLARALARDLGRPDHCLNGLEGRLAGTTRNGLPLLLHLLFLSGLRLSPLLSLPVGGLVLLRP